MLKIIERIGLPITNTSGIDCYEDCLDKKHFRNYPKEITYQYNSRGFRDLEWPNDLTDVIWCVGDSFTTGIGQPFKETWPQILEKKIGKRCLNIGEDGCSNDMMRLRAEEIVKKYNPKLIIIMWSYISRRLSNGKNIHYDYKDFNSESDLKNFLSNFNKIDKLPVKILHTAIPYAFWTKQTLDVANKKTNGKLILYRQIDFARDYHHFDIKTSEFVCKLICNVIANKLKGFDK